MVKLVNIEEKNPNNFWVNWGISMKTYDIIKLQKTGIHHFSEKHILGKTTGWSQIEPTLYFG